MVAPTTVIVKEGKTILPAGTKALDPTLLLLGGEKLVFWNGHEFEIEPCGLYRGDPEDWYQFEWGETVYETSAMAYYPLDPRMTETDIAGATVAYPNETNDGWLFAHCDKDFHIDHEFKLLAGVTTAFERQMHVLHKALRTATYTALLSSTSDSRDAFGAASRAYDELGNFREDVKAYVLAQARKLHLGYYHTEPNTPNLSLIHI